jgi:hypothetical protein
VGVGLESPKDLSIPERERERDSSIGIANAGNVGNNGIISNADTNHDTGHDTNKKLICIMIQISYVQAPMGTYQYYHFYRYTVFFRY